MRRLPPAPRATFLRDGAREVKDDQSDAVAFVSEYAGFGGKVRYSAIGFHGKADKPDFNFYYNSADQRDAKVKAFFEGRRVRAKMMDERKAARNGYVHDYKVGDVFVSSWGYDQTNVDFYEVVEVPSNKTVKVRAIQQGSVETMSMQGECWPLPGKFVANAPVMLKKVHEYGFKPRDFRSSARLLVPELVSGQKVYPKCRWSSYA